MHKNFRKNERSEIKHRTISSFLKFAPSFELIEKLMQNFKQMSLFSAKTAKPKLWKLTTNCTLYSLTV